MGTPRSQIGDSKLFLADEFPNTAGSEPGATRR